MNPFNLLQPYLRDVFEMLLGDFFEKQEVQSKTFGIGDLRHLQFKNLKLNINKFNKQFLGLTPFKLIKGQLGLLEVKILQSNPQVCLKELQIDLVFNSDLQKNFEREMREFNLADELDNYRRSLELAKYMPGSGETDQNQLGFLKNYIKSLLKAISVRIENVALKIYCLDKDNQSSEHRPFLLIQVGELDIYKYNIEKARSQPDQIEESIKPSSVKEFFIHIGGVAGYLLTRDLSYMEYENFQSQNNIKKEYPFYYPTPSHPAAIFVLAESEKLKLEAKIYQNQLDKVKVVVPSLEIQLEPQHFKILSVFLHQVQIWAHNVDVINRFNLLRLQKIIQKIDVNDIYNQGGQEDVQNQDIFQSALFVSISQSIIKQKESSQQQRISENRNFEQTIDEVLDKSFSKKDINENIKKYIQDQQNEQISTNNFIPQKNQKLDLSVQLTSISLLIFKKNINNTTRSIYQKSWHFQSKASGSPHEYIKDVSSLSLQFIQDPSVQQLFSQPEGYFNLFLSNLEVRGHLYTPPLSENKNSAPVKSQLGLQLSQLQVCDVNVTEKIQQQQQQQQNKQESLNQSVDLFKSFCDASSLQKFIFDPTKHQFHIKDLITGAETHSNNQLDKFMQMKIVGYQNGYHLQLKEFLDKQIYGNPQINKNCPQSQDLNYQCSDISFQICPVKVNLDFSVLQDILNFAKEISERNEYNDLILLQDQKYTSFLADSGHNKEAFLLEKEDLRLQGGFMVAQNLSGKIEALNLYFDLSGGRALQMDVRGLETAIKLNQNIIQIGESIAELKLEALLTNYIEGQKLLKILDVNKKNTNNQKFSLLVVNRNPSQSNLKENQNFVSFELPTVAVNLSPHIINQLFSLQKELSLVLQQSESQEYLYYKNDLNKQLDCIKCNISNYQLSIEKYISSHLDSQTIESFKSSVLNEDYQTFLSGQLIISELKLRFDVEVSLKDAIYILLGPVSSKVLSEDDFIKMEHFVIHSIAVFDDALPVPLFECPYYLPKNNNRVQDVEINGHLIDHRKQSQMLLYSYKNIGFKDNRVPHLIENISSTYFVKQDKWNIYKKSLLNSVRENFKCLVERENFFTMDVELNEKKKFIKISAKLDALIIKPDFKLLTLSKIKQFINCIEFPENNPNVSEQKQLEKQTDQNIVLFLQLNSLFIDLQTYYDLNYMTSYQNLNQIIHQNVQSPEFRANYNQDQHFSQLVRSLLWIDQIEIQCRLSENQEYSNNINIYQSNDFLLTQCLNQSKIEENNSAFKIKINSVRYFLQMLKYNEFFYFSQPKILNFKQFCDSPPLCLNLLRYSELFSIENIELNNNNDNLEFYVEKIIAEFCVDKLQYLLFHIKNIQYLTQQYEGAKENGVDQNLQKQADKVQNAKKEPLKFEIEMLKRPDQDEFLDSFIIIDDDEDTQKKNQQLSWSNNLVNEGGSNASKVLNKNSKIESRMSLNIKIVSISLFEGRDYNLDFSLSENELHNFLKNPHPSHEYIQLVKNKGSQKLDNNYLQLILSNLALEQTGYSPDSEQNSIYKQKKKEIFFSLGELELLDNLNKSKIKKIICKRSMSGQKQAGKRDFFNLAIILYEIKDKDLEKPFEVKIETQIHPIQIFANNKNVEFLIKNLEQIQNAVQKLSADELNNKLKTFIKGSRSQQLEEPKKDKNQQNLQVNKQMASRKGSIDVFASYQNQFSEEKQMEAKNNLSQQQIQQQLEVFEQKLQKQQSNSLIKQIYISKFRLENIEIYFDYIADFKEFIKLGSQAYKAMNFGDIKELEITLDHVEEEADNLDQLIQAVQKKFTKEILQDKYKILLSAPYISNFYNITSGLFGILYQPYVSYTTNKGLLFGVKEGVMGAVSALGHESLNVLDTLTWLVNKNLNQNVQQLKNFIYESESNKNINKFK